MLEESLRAVDPSISHPYWDFMIDAGRDWQNSTVFSDDFFGPVRTSAADDWVVASGPFAYLPSVWDESGAYSEIANENAYGVITETFNPIKSPYMQRSSQFCGRENKQPMAGCADAIHCMNSKRTLGEWDLCLEINVHANLHPWMGGCWDCHGGDDWGTLTARNATFWPEDVLDFVGPNLATIWNSMSRPVGRSGAVMTCPGPRSCVDRYKSNASAMEASGDCKCVCNITDTEIASMSPERFMNVSGIDSALFLLSGTYLQNHFLDRGSRLCDGLFSYEWKHLHTCDEQVAFNKWLFSKSCQPGVQGNVGTLASPSDPLFNLMHPLFDKLAHVMRLAPQYTNSSSAYYIDQSWQSCDNTTLNDNRWRATSYGSAFDDKTPFY